MPKALNYRDDIECMCQQKNEEEDWPAFKIVLIQWLEDYIKKHRVRLITTTRNKTDNTSINWTKITKKTTV